MINASDLPDDLKSCQQLVIAQREQLAAQQKQTEALQVEQEKLRTLLTQLVNGNRSEKRIFSGADQMLLPWMKQVALGRKAWLFVGNVEAGQRSAMMMTMVSSAKRHDLDVGLYIKDVLDQLLAGCTDYESLLPDRWKQRHPEAIREYRQQERCDRAARKQYRAAQRRLARRKKISI